MTTLPPPRRRHFRPSSSSSSSSTRGGPPPTRRAPPCAHRLQKMTQAKNIQGARQFSVLARESIAVVSHRRGLRSSFGSTTNSSDNGDDDHDKEEKAALQAILLQKRKEARQFRQSLQQQQQQSISSQGVQRQNNGSGAQQQRQRQQRESLFFQPLERFSFNSTANSTTTTTTNKDQQHDRPSAMTSTTTTTTNTRDSLSDPHLAPEEHSMEFGYGQQQDARTSELSMGLYDMIGGGGGDGTTIPRDSWNDDIIPMAFHSLATTTAPGDYRVSTVFRLSAVDIDEQRRLLGEQRTSCSIISTTTTEEEENNLDQFHLSDADIRLSVIDLEEQQRLLAEVTNNKNPDEGEDTPVLNDDDYDYYDDYEDGNNDDDVEEPCIPTTITEEIIAEHGECPENAAGSNNCDDDEKDVFVEVAPGLKFPIARISVTTRDALEGNVVFLNCINCCDEFFCSAQAAMVVCAECWTFNPVQPPHVDLRDLPKRQQFIDVGVKPNDILQELEEEEEEEE